MIFFVSKLFKGIVWFTVNKIVFTGWQMEFRLITHFKVGFKVNYRKVRAFHFHRRWVVFQELSFNWGCVQFVHTLFLLIYACWWVFFHAFRFCVLGIVCKFSYFCVVLIYSAVVLWNISAFYSYPLWDYWLVVGH